MPRFKLHWDGIEWGGPKGDWWYIYWWDWLPRGKRYWGYDQFWYDGPHSHYGLWFTRVSWMAPWMHIPPEKEWHVDYRSRD